jgi:hypothetical protein
MRNFKALLVISAVISMVYSSAYALAPMGPPKSILEQDQWSLGLEYGHSEMDIETSKGTATSTSVPGTFDKQFEIDGLKSNMIYVNMGLGLGSNWDIYMRLGLSDAKSDVSEIKYGSDEFKNFDADFGLNWGIGTRATFYQQDNLSLGGLIQANFVNPGSGDITLTNAPGFISGEAEIEYWEIQVAFGPTLELDSCRIYGGPFLHLINGDFSIEQNVSGTITKSECDLEHDIQIGGYVGTEIDLQENSSLVAEVQFTGDAVGIGLGITWKF